MLAMNGPKPLVVIVCHRVPEWAAQMPAHVYFLNLGNHPLLAADSNDVKIDKGLKYILGITWAKSIGMPRYILLCDGDDYLHRDLMATVLSAEADLGERDGFIIKNGVHALLDWDNSSLKLRAAFQVKQFNQTCGTCRIFRAAALTKGMTTLSEQLWDLPLRWKLNKDRREVIIDASSIDTLFSVCRLYFDQEQGFVRLLGRHIRQSPAFDFLPLKAPLAAKGCGHGNHDGPRGGDLHWHRITAMVNNVTFVKNFGLTGNIDYRERPSVALAFKGCVRAVRNRLGNF